MTMFPRLYHTKRNIILGNNNNKTTLSNCVDDINIVVFFIYNLN